MRNTSLITLKECSTVGNKFGINLAKCVGGVMRILLFNPATKRVKVLDSQIKCRKLQCRIDVQSFVLQILFSNSRSPATLGNREN